MTDPSVLTLLESHRGTAWHPEAPVSEEEVAAAEAAVRHRFPRDYREVLRAAGSAGIYGSEARVLLIPPRHLVQFNPDRERFPRLERMLIFAHDQGNYVYFYDPENRLGRGAGAIFMVEMSVASPERAIFVARDLRHLVERILAGEAFIE